MGSPKEDISPTLTETFHGEWTLETVGDTLKYQKIIPLSDEFFAAAVRKGGVIVKIEGLIGMDTLRMNGKVLSIF